MTQRDAATLRAAERVLARLGREQAERHENMAAIRTLVLRTMLDEYLKAAHA